MKKLMYNYQTIIRFSSAVANHDFKLRAIPCNNEFQHKISESFQLNSYSWLESGVDCFGNGLQYGSLSSPHDYFAFSSSGEIEQRLYKETVRKNEFVELFKNETRLTRLSEDMFQFFNKELKDPFLSVKEQIAALSDKVYKTIYYSPGSTNMQTSAEEAFMNKKGVCQDFAHILLSLCRSCGIVCRYVNGFLVGEGFTHAWIEFLDNGIWYGFDPTHNRFIDYGYIKIAHGRDASDIMINRGVFTGNAYQELEIRTLVEEL